MNRGELERMTNKQLRCTLYDCRRKKYIPYRCLLPKGIHRMKKFDLIELMMTLEYFIPTCIVVENKYDRVNKRLILNYLDTKVENGSNRLINRKLDHLNKILEMLGASSYDVLRYAIDTELTVRENRRSISPYVDKVDIERRHIYHHIAINSLVVRRFRLDMTTEEVINLLENLS